MWLIHNLENAIIYIIKVNWKMEWNFWEISTYQVVQFRYGETDEYLKVVSELYIFA